MFGTPNARDAEPEVVASAVSYFAKPESYFVTGGYHNLSGTFPRRILKS